MPPRPPFKIGPHAIAAGVRAVVHLPVSVLPDDTPVTLSVEVIHGRQDGPIVFVSAAIHGDEVVGVEIARRLLRAPALRGLRGTLLVVPIVNTYGFLARSRYLPDRRDLNRSFPGRPGGSLAARLAHLFLTEVVARSQMGIDLHSAAIHRVNLPQMRVTPGQQGALMLAQVFGAPVVLIAPERPGSLRTEARARGVEVLLFEGGEGLRFDEDSIRIGLAGILRVLRHKGMIGRGDAARDITPMICSSATWLRAPVGGLLRSCKMPGDHVQPGDLLATVSGPFGERAAELRAPTEGVIVGQAVLPVVNEGDAIFHLGRISAQGAVLPAVPDPVFDEDEII